MSKYVDVNVELLKKVVKKSGLTQEQFNEDMRLPKCKRMVHNCIARGKLRKDQAYVIIQKYGLDEREFILGNDAEEVHPALEWLQKLEAEQLENFFNVGTIEELLMSDLPINIIKKAYEWSLAQAGYSKRCQGIQDRLIDIIQEFDATYMDLDAALNGLKQKGELNE